jgi:hypothetical protein
MFLVGLMESIISADELVVACGEPMEDLLMLMCWSSGVGVHVSRQCVKFGMSGTRHSLYRIQHYGL